MKSSSEKIVEFLKQKRDIATLPFICLLTGAETKHLIQVSRVGISKIVKKPICLSDIKRQALNGDFLLYPDKLQQACESVFENAKNYNEVKTDYYKTSCRMLDKKVNKLFAFDRLKQKLYRNKLISGDENLHSA